MKNLLPRCGGDKVATPKIVRAGRINRRLYLEALESRTLLSAYVVSTSGSDSAAGTAASPWLTLQKAADNVKAGDVVTVTAGTYAGFQLTTAHSGAANAEITFAAQPGVIINRAGPNSPDAINLEGASYITIEGFSINNKLGAITRGGIRAVTDQNVTIQNNTVDGAEDWDIFTAFSNDVLIQNNTASNAVTQHGIYVSNSGDRPIIRDNTVFGNHDCGIHMNGDISEQQGGGIVDDGIISNALVEGNIIYDNGIGGGSAINADGVQNSTFSNNLIYDNFANGISLFRTDGGGPSSGNLVANNTIVMPANARWCINIQNGAVNNTVTNNILDNQNPGHGAITLSADSLPGLTSDYNLIINNRFSPNNNTYETLAQWQSATGQDLHSILSTQAATFIDAPDNGYQLFPNSSAVNHATPANAPANDIDGNPRSSATGYDIGAFQLPQNAGAPVTPPPVTPPPVTPPVVPPPTTTSQQTVSLNGRFNTTGIYAPGSTFYKRAGLDGAGNAFSAAELGATITAAGSVFTIRPQNMTNVVSAKGQTIKLPKGQDSELTFLGAAVNGTQTGTFTITYTDGSTQAVTQTLSDWSASSNEPGEVLAKTMTSYVNYAGRTIQRPTNLYAYTITLNPAKTVKSITLPKNSSIKLLAMDLLA